MSNIEKCLLRIFFYRAVTVTLDGVVAISIFVVVVIAVIVADVVTVVVVVIVVVTVVAGDADFVKLLKLRAGTSSPDTEDLG